MNANDNLLVLGGKDVANVVSTLSPQTLMALMTSVFRRLSAKDRIDMPQRTTIANKNSRSTLFMPAWLDDFGTSIKVVSLPTEKNEHHSSDDPRSKLSATTLLLDQRSGKTTAIINATALTALRNAAGVVPSAVVGQNLVT